MQRLFLGSNGLGALPAFLGGSPAGLAVAFVPTAANYLASIRGLERSPAEADRERLLALGCLVDEVDLDTASPRHVRRAVLAADLLFVCGGSVSHLLHAAHRTAFDRAVIDFIATGKPYVGLSAGAIILGPDIKAAPESDHLQDANLRTTAAIGLVPFAIWPHFGGSAERQEWYRRTVERYGDELEIVPLRDDQAMVVEGDRRRLVESA